MVSTDADLDPNASCSGAGTGIIANPFVESENPNRGNPVTR